MPPQQKRKIRKIKRHGRSVQDRFLKGPLHSGSNANFSPVNKVFFNFKKVII